MKTMRTNTKTRIEPLPAACPAGMRLCACPLFRFRSAGRPCRRLANGRGRAKAQAETRTRDAFPFQTGRFRALCPPRRGSLLERTKAPSPAGSPPPLFSAPFRAALSLSAQRHSALRPFPMPLCAPTHNRGGSCLRTCRTAIGAPIRLPPHRPLPHGAPPSPFFSRSPFRSSFLFPPVLRRATPFSPAVGRPHIPSPSACTANACVLLCHPLPVPAAGVGLRLPVPLYRPHASPPGHPFPFFCTASHRPLSLCLVSRILFL